VANVYADRVPKMAYGQEVGVILGRIMAHELGHLLLGKNEHSRAGVMRAEWLSDDRQSRTPALMLFLPGEAKRIRAQVLARSRDTTYFSPL
jgi:hypothetical protein